MNEQAMTPSDFDGDKELAFAEFHNQSDIRKLLVSATKGGNKLMTFVLNHQTYMKE